MKRIPISQFKANCAEQIRLVEKDQREIAITRHGRIIAKVAPAWPSKPSASWLGSGPGVSFAEDFDPGESAAKDEEWDASS